MKMMLVTGGTGGHIYPALALADAAVQRYGNEAKNQEKKEKLLFYDIYSRNTSDLYVYHFA